MNMDTKFDPLQLVLGLMKINLKTTGQVNHVPEEENLICTTKDISRATLSVTLFKTLTTSLTVRIILTTTI